MQDEHKLNIYNEAYALSLDIYRKIKFPDKEKFGMEQQIRRSSMSVSLNIAEACGKDSQADFKRCLYISMGSLKETETLIDFAKDLSYISSGQHKEFKDRITTLGKQINSLIQKIKEG
ncbi:four helix bundle protein [Candidatus Woesearchaeota archaeon]|nr:four helix bundle protein [Candidatus Woesearchaeota archaeon]